MGFSKALAALAEFFGEQGLILGFLTRISAYRDMLCNDRSYLQSSFKGLFFMNWLLTEDRGQGVDIFPHLASNRHLPHAFRQRSAGVKGKTDA